MEIMRKAAGYHHKKMLLTQLIMAVQQIHKWESGASRRSFSIISIFSIFQHFSVSFSIFHNDDGNDDDDDGDAVGENQ